MELSKYILDLLYRYELVIIPDLGGLLVKSLSAQIDERSHTFSPPSKRLGFNAQLTDNDGLLANHIASVDKVPYETALNFIKFEVKNLLETLQNNDVVLDSIGTFSLNTEGNLLFDPNPDANFLTESFGFTNIVSPAVSRVELQETDLSAIFDTITEDIEQEEIAINQEVSRTGLSPILKYAAIGLLVFSLGYFGWNKFGKNFNSSQNVVNNDADAEMIKTLQEAKFEIPAELATINVTVNKEEVTETDENTSDSNKSEEDISNSSDKTTVDNTSTEQANTTATTDKTNSTTNSTDVASTTDDTNIESSTKPTETTTQKEEKSVAVNTGGTTGKYHIIAGAFKVPENATKKVNQLTAKGYNAHIVGVNKWQLTQVAFGSYTSKSEAQTALRQIKNTEAKDAWLLVK